MKAKKINIRKALSYLASGFVAMAFVLFGALQRGGISVAQATYQLDVTGFTVDGSFSHANKIIISLMPLALIAFGIGLGFVVLRFIRSLL